MKKTVLSRLAAFFVLCAAVFGPVNLVGSAFTSGPPANYTGAPGENDCTGCHDSFNVNSGTAAFTITAPLGYVPITAQTVTVGFTGSTASKYGFEITARDGADNPAGGWAAVMPGMTKNALGSSFHHEHTSSGTQLSSWTMSWLSPPALPPGPVTFHAAGAETNASNSPHGDHIYTTTHKLYQATLSTPSTGWTIGASHALSLSVPNHAGDLYFIVPSLNPAPFALGGPFNLEVTPDDIFPLVTQLPEVFQNLFGTLDGAAQATAAIAVPYHPPLIGISLHLAAVTATAAMTPTEVSNRLTVTFQ